MKNRWSAATAKKIKNDSLEMRIYTSRLLGQEEDLVLHGGGNTSVKLQERNVFGENEHLIYVKGSGGDLASIGPGGFAALKMEPLMKMLTLPALTDSDMVKNLRLNLTSPSAPNPSIEVLLHALIPFTFVDHTHADAVVTLTDTPQGHAHIHRLYGDSVLVIPYVKPGFILAKNVFEQTRNIEWHKLQGIVLMNHGVFTFDRSAQRSYEKMIRLVTMAERAINRQARIRKLPVTKQNVDLIDLAKIRRAVSKAWGQPVLAKLDERNEAVGFSNHPHIDRLATRGTITPDHVIRTRRAALVLGEHTDREVSNYVADYRSYFAKHKRRGMVPLDPAPRWAVWKKRGAVYFGRSLNDTRIVFDIARHTMKAVLQAEALGGWKPLNEKDLFDIEYWELEQAKLKTQKTAPAFQGKIALVTGAASGIGKACVETLRHGGAVVAALDIHKNISDVFQDAGVLGLRCDVTDESAIKAAVEATVKQFGGLDFIVSNAGQFPPSRNVADLDAALWKKSLDVNLTSHQTLLRYALPYLEHGIEPAAVVIGSKNVAAPGPGASAYSVAKAGLTQLCRVAALELGRKGIRINVVHPNAVYDTGIWTKEVLNTRARSYGLTVDAYKRNNVLGTEVTSQDVAALVSALLGPVFRRTTGAQIPIDGGNDRVI